MTQALTKPQNKDPRALQVVDREFRENRIARLIMSDVTQLANAFYASGSFPDLKSEAQAAVKIIAGHELGFSPVVSMTGIHFFQGKVVIGANLLASLIKDSGKYEYKITEHTDKVCKIVIYQKFGGELKQMGVPVIYTIEDAVKAGLATKDNWKKFPKDMLFAACIRQSARRYCADILRGTSTEHANPVEQEVDNYEVEAANENAVDGEIVEQVEPELVRDEVITEAPLFDEQDSKTVNLRIAIEDLLDEKFPRDAKGRKSFLKGKEIANEAIESLEQIHGELIEL